MLLTLQSGLQRLAPRAQSVPAYAQVLRHSSIALSQAHSHFMVGRMCRSYQGAGASSAELLVDGLADAQGVRRDREARVRAAARGEARRVHNIQVVDIVDSVVRVEDALGRVDSEATGPADMPVVEELQGAQRDHRVPVGRRPPDQPAQ